MKKIIPMFSISILTIILAGFLTFANGPVKRTSNAKETVVLCSTGETIAFPTAKKFNPEEYNLPTTLVRKNVNTLTVAEINSIKAGITAMKALPYTDPTSWEYQAAIHWTTRPNNLPSWNSCQHGTQFFLSWHRMYLYFFERILRAKSGNPNLTLPYWDYQTDPVLHLEYRNNTAGNPLYDATRFNSINSGGSLPASIMNSINNAINNNIPYFDFQDDLEAPHGNVHTSVGGNMVSVSTAGLDPAFWLHHTNIDRLWEQWLRKCGGRVNPTSDATWMAQTYTFFDETGAAVNMTGSQIVNTASSLSYRYDFPFIFPCDFVLRDWKYILYKPYKFPLSIRFDQKINRAPFSQAVVTDDTKNIKNLTLNFSKKDITDKVFVELNGVEIEKMPEGVIEVYVNLSDRVVTPNPNSKNFAGVLDLFTAAAHARHNNKNTPLRVNISTAISNLKLKATDLNKMKLTFFVRGNKVKGREIDAKSAIKIDNMDLVIAKAVRD